MMLLAVIKALAKYNNTLNTAISHEYFLLSITVTFVIANGLLTSINQTSASILAVVCVSSVKLVLGSAVTG